MNRPRQDTQAPEDMMSDPGVPRPDLREQPVAEPARPVRCRLAAGSGPRFTDEMAALLRARLRLAILILLAGFSFHSFRSLWLHGFAFGDRPPRLLLGDSAVAALAVASALLGSRRPLSVRGLRAVELAVFGVLAAYLGW